MELTDLSWPVVNGLSRDVPIVIPVAALEQHGHHLPVFTDSMLLGEIVRRARTQVTEPVVWAPLMWWGNSEHHMDFPGTMSASPRTYLNLLNELAENFLCQGFRRIMFINGHGGNDVPGRQAVFELRQRHRGRKDLLLLFGTYWSLGVKPWETIPGLHQRQMGHACEWETSMILKIAPQLVGDYRKAGTVKFGDAFEPASRGWTMPDRSVPGHIGSPEFASVEKGEALLSAFAAGVAAMVRRVATWDGKSWEG